MKKINNADTETLKIALEILSGTEEVKLEEFDELYDKIQEELEKRGEL